MRGPESDERLELRRMDLRGGMSLRCRLDCLLNREGSVSWRGNLCGLVFRGLPDLARVSNGACDWVRRMSRGV